MCLLPGIEALLVEVPRTCEVTQLTGYERCVFAKASGGFRSRLARCGLHGDRPLEVPICQLDIMVRAAPAMETPQTHEGRATLAVRLDGSFIQVPSEVVVLKTTFRKDGIPGKYVRVRGFRIHRFLEQALGPVGVASPDVCCPPPDPGCRQPCTQPGGCIGSWTTELHFCKRQLC